MWIKDLTNFISRYNRESPRIFPAYKLTDFKNLVSKSEIWLMLLKHRANNLILKN